MWLASVMCTGFWIIGAELLTWFRALFTGGGPTALEAFGGLFVMMLWFDRVSQLLFYGAEVCKVIYLRETAAATSRP